MRASRFWPRAARSLYLCVPLLCAPYGGCVAQEPYQPPSQSMTEAGGGHAGSLNIDPGTAGAETSDGGAAPIDVPNGCTTSAQCGPPFPHCVPNLGRCVECTSNNNCFGTSRRFCDPKSYTCVSCLTEQQCPMTAPYCASAVGTCVQCLTTGNCGDASLVCDRVNFRCVPTCVTNDDCAATVDTPFCDPSRSLCVACADDGDCTALAPRCATQVGSCVECVEDADCPANVPRCDTRAHRCVQCLVAQDCAPGATCVAGACINPK